MGLSFYFSGSLQNAEDLSSLIEEIVDVSRVYGWKYHIYNPNFPNDAFENNDSFEKGCPVPQQSFDEFMELKVGNEKVNIDFLGEGHTCDNIIGYFSLDEIMFGGCLIKEPGAGKGNLEEANVAEWSETVKKVKKKYPNVKIIIPGHGKVGDIELLDYTIQLFE
jgi:metallo-beta-lactamase class B